MFNCGNLTIRSHNHSLELQRITCFTSYSVISPNVSPWSTHESLWKHTLQDRTTSPRDWSQTSHDSCHWWRQASPHLHAHRPVCLSGQSLSALERAPLWHPPCSKKDLWRVRKNLAACTSHQAARCWTGAWIQSGSDFLRVFMKNLTCMWRREKLGCFNWCLGPQPQKRVLL